MANTYTICPPQVCPKPSTCSEESLNRCPVDDERLDALLESLDRKAPDLASSHSSEHEVGSEEYTLQISGPVADEFARVHKAIQKLSRSFVQKFGPMVH